MKHPERIAFSVSAAFLLMCLFGWFVNQAINKQAVIAEHHGTDASSGEHPFAHGISIYIPYRRDEYQFFKGEYAQTQFAKDTTWDQFIYALWIGTGYLNVLCLVDHDHVPEGIG